MAPDSRSSPAPASGAPGTKPRRESASPSGWDRYVSVLENNRIPVNQRRWYVLRAEAFVDAVRPTRMGEVSAEQITTFFPRYARDQRLNAWQYRQTVDAVQLLLVDLAQSRAAREIDWDFWKEAGKAMDGVHPTIAKGLTPDEAVEAQPRYARSTGQYPLLKSLARTLLNRPGVVPVRSPVDLLSSVASGPAGGMASRREDTPPQTGEVSWAARCCGQPWSGRSTLPVA